MELLFALTGIFFRFYDRTHYKDAHKLISPPANHRF